MARLARMMTMNLQWSHRRTMLPVINAVEVIMKECLLKISLNQPGMSLNRSREDFRSSASRSSEAEYMLSPVPRRFCILVRRLKTFALRAQVALTGFHSPSAELQ